MSTRAQRRNLDLVHWSLNGSTYNVVTKFKEAHYPKTIGGGLLGYMASSVSGAFFVGLVVEQIGFGAVSVNVRVFAPFYSLDLTASNTKLAVNLGPCHVGSYIWRRKGSGP